MTGMEEQREKAGHFRPDLAALAKQADLIDSNYRRYIDGCYRKYTRTTTSGYATGSGTSSGEGAAVGRDWFVVWNQTTNVAWQEVWETQGTVDNASTAQCRMLWSDLVSDSNEFRHAMEELASKARARRVIPGVMRDLLAEYRLVSDWW